MKERSEARLKLIESRQSPPGWGPDYQPAMRATPSEAPKISRPSTVFWPKLGRNLHFMSVPERTACLLALYNPKVFEVREQHMLERFPAPHPLHEHGPDWRPVKGTVDAAERLEMLAEHPVIWVKTGKRGTHEEIRLAFPYLGDLLLFLEDGQGKYCVNWTVKAQLDSFSRSGDRFVQNARKAARRAERRHRLEELYFADAGIRTVRIAASLIDEDLTRNLTRLAAWQADRPDLSEPEITQVKQDFANLLEMKQPPLALLSKLALDDRLHQTDKVSAYKAVLFQAIWNHELHVDLYQPILMDKPLRPETRNPLDEFHHWFVR